MSADGAAGGPIELSNVGGILSSVAATFGLGRGGGRSSVSDLGFLGKFLRGSPLGAFGGV
eukprot:329704-Amphidinium_carterae.1